MYQGTVPRLFMRYALPQMVGLLFNSAYVIVDGVFIGNPPGHQGHGRRRCLRAPHRDPHRPVHSHRRRGGRTGVREPGPGGPGPGGPALVDFTWRRSLLYFSGFFLSGFSILMISYWQSTQRTGRALAVSLSRSLLWPPVLTLLLPLLLGREALWVCHSLAEVLTAGTALLLLRRGA